MTSLFGSFLPSLLVGFSTTNFTRAWEPTLSWNQIHLIDRELLLQHVFPEDPLGLQGQRNEESQYHLLVGEAGHCEQWRSGKLG